MKRFFLRENGGLRKSAHLALAVFLFIGLTALVAAVPSFGPYYGTSLTFVGSILAFGLGAHIGDKKLVDGAAKALGLAKEDAK